MGYETICSCAAGDSISGNYAAGEDLASPVSNPGNTADGYDNMNTRSARIDVIVTHR